LEEGIGELLLALRAAATIFFAVIVGILVHMHSAALEFSG